MYFDNLTDEADISLENLINLVNKITWLDKELSEE